MFERFTDRARRVVVLAQVEARDFKHDHIGTEHLLLGLLAEGEGIGCQALSALGVSPDGVRTRVQEIIGSGLTQPSGHIPFTPRAKKVMELSLREALQLGHNYIGTEHILLGLIREGEGVAAQLLVISGAELTVVRRQVIQLLSGYHGTTTLSAGGGSGGGGGSARIAAAAVPFAPAEDLDDFAHALLMMEHYQKVVRDYQDLESGRRQFQQAIAADEAARDATENAALGAREAEVHRLEQEAADAGATRVGELQQVQTRILALRTALRRAQANTEEFAAYVCGLLPAEGDDDGKDADDDG